MGMCIDEIDGAEPYSVEVRSSHGEFVVHGADIHDYVYNGTERPEHAIGVSEERRPSKVRTHRMGEEDFETAMYLVKSQGSWPYVPDPVKRTLFKLLEEVERARAVEDERRGAGVGSVTFALEDIPKLRVVFDAVEEYVASQRVRT